MIKTLFQQLSKNVGADLEAATWTPAWDQVSFETPATTLSFPWSFFLPPSTFSLGSLLNQGWGEPPSRAEGM
jgi:hypothetical protein